MKNAVLKFFSPPPTRWKKIRNLFGSIAAAITAGVTGTNAIGLVLPSNIVTILAFIVFVTLSIATYAQSKEEVIEPVIKKKNNSNQKT
jgi:tetrahydromethanopterin S-methyltransferase subunit B